MLLTYRADPSSTAVGERIGVMRHTVRRCARRAMLDRLNLGDELRTSYAAVT